MVNSMDIAVGHVGVCITAGGVGVFVASDANVLVGVVPRKAPFAPRNTVQASICYLYC